jgi:hypothetical protein
MILGSQSIDCETNHLPHFIPLIPQEGSTNPETDEKKPAHLNEYLNNLNQAIERHPYLKERQTYQEQYLHAQSYITLKSLQYNDALPDITRYELAQRVGIGQCGLNKWLNDEGESRLTRSIKVHEIYRQKYEAKLTLSALKHRIDPSYVYTCFHPIKDHLENDNAGLLARAIANLHQSTENQYPIQFAELRPYAPTGPKWLRGIAENINTQKNEIERLLNEQFKLTNNPHITIRIGIVNDTLFIRQHNTNPNKWINLFAQENFYINTPENKNQLLQKSQETLNVNSLDFARLVRQITYHPSKPIVTEHYLNDQDPMHNLLKGETLHLILDTMNRTIHDLRPLISHIGTGAYERGRLQNPQFPPLEPLRTQLLAIMYSDGHLSWQRRLHYAEKDTDRIEYVKSLFNQLGDIQFYELKREDGITEIQYPKIIGQLFEQWGMPIGDRAIQNMGLPTNITQGNRDIKIAYIHEFIPEDGSFDSGDNIKGRFRWARTVVLDAGPKNEMYGLVPQLTKENRDFIRQYGTEKTVFFQPDIPSTHIRLSWKMLQELKDSQIPQERKAAERLIKIIESNPSNLLEDEKRICESLGFRITCKPVAICLWSSRRTTFIWEAGTADINSALKWAHLAPPNDTRKRAKVEDWLHKRKAQGLPT